MKDLQSYDNITDATCVREFAEDHMPRAANLALQRDQWPDRLRQALPERFS